MEPFQTMDTDKNRKIKKIPTNVSSLPTI